MQNSLLELADRYFEFMAKNFPIMCASDEFHFMPRAEAAAHYYDLIDNLSKDVINEILMKLREFISDFERLDSIQDKESFKGVKSSLKESNLERFIDLELLRASAGGVLIELEQKKSWQNNPLLYLKIAFTGLHHAIIKPAQSRKEIFERLLARLYGIPVLFRQATENIHSVPTHYMQSSMAMLSDCVSYLTELKDYCPNDDIGDYSEALNGVWLSLNRFRDFLNSCSARNSDQLSTEKILEATLRSHFLSIRDAQEIFQIALEQWHYNLNELNRLQSEIDSRKKWQELYNSYNPQELGKMDTITLYKQENERLRSFFKDKVFDGYEDMSLEICETPTYLQTIRGSASFSTALCPNSGEKSFFYITQRQSKKQDEKSWKSLMKRLHREYKYLTAHETFPGHHLLDYKRRMLENPVRRQIELPLFYEGWASYAESLLIEYFYVTQPIELLIHRKRNLWRAARCQIDIGLCTGMLTMEEGIELLTGAGFTGGEAKNQIERFALNPGYQLCYSLGCYEILKLRELFGTHMGREGFHTKLLECGELPFHLIAKRFECMNKQ